MTRSRLLAVLGIAATVFLAGCASGSGRDTKEPTVPTVTEDEAVHAVQTYANALQAQLGGSELTEYGVTPGACEKPDGTFSDDRFDVAGSYDVAVPRPDQHARINALHQRWSDEGWTIITWTTVASGDRVLTGRDPKYAFSVTIGTRYDFDKMDVTIGTPCYKKSTDDTD